MYMEILNEQQLKAFIEDEDKQISVYVDYVIQKVTEFSTYTESLDKPDISLIDIEQILKNRARISLAMNAEYTLLRRQLNNRQKEFKVWWSQMYSSIRVELNPITLAASKWTSKTEIESEIIARYSEYYKQNIEKIETLEDQLSFHKSLMDNWDKIQVDCTQLIKILGYDIDKLNSLDRINKQIENNINSNKKIMPRNKGVMPHNNITN